MARRYLLGLCHILPLHVSPRITGVTRNSVNLATERYGNIQGKDYIEVLLVEIPAVSVKGSPR